MLDTYTYIYFLFRGNVKCLYLTTFVSFDVKRLRINFSSMEKCFHLMVNVDINFFSNSMLNVYI